MNGGLKKIRNKFERDLRVQAINIIIYLIFTSHILSDCKQKTTKHFCCCFFLQRISKWKNVIDIFDVKMHSKKRMNAIYKAIQKCLQIKTNIAHSFDVIVDGIHLDWCTIESWRSTVISCNIRMDFLLLFNQPQIGKNVIISLCSYYSFYYYYFERVSLTCE